MEIYLNNADINFPYRECSYSKYISFMLTIKFKQMKIHICQIHVDAYVNTYSFILQNSVNICFHSYMLICIRKIKQNCTYLQNLFNDSNCNQVQFYPCNDSV